MSSHPDLDVPSRPSLSPYETVVAFDPVRPLARIPVPAGQGDDLAQGPCVLAFRSEDAWRHSWSTCRQKIEAQCQAGGAMGCSLGAAKACERPWWTKLLASGPDENQSEARAECEAREMRGCLLSSHEKCAAYARETCDSVFADMRIAASGAPIDRRFNVQPRVTRYDKLGADTQTHSPRELRSPESTADEEDSDGLGSVGITTFRGGLLLRHEGTRAERMQQQQPSWSASTHAPEQSALPSPFPSEGWVGGLVHPREKNLSPENEGEGGGSVPKGPVCRALDLWQAVMERFTSS